MAPVAAAFAAIAPYLTIASTAFTFISGIVQANQSSSYGQQMSEYYKQMAEQQKFAAESQAGAYEANAAMAGQEAQSIIGQTQQETLKLSRERRKLLGAQAALYGGAGVSLMGSPLEVMASTAEGFEDDIQALGYAGDVKMRAKMYESDLDKWMAEQARKSGELQAKGTSMLADSALQKGEDEWWGNMFKAGGSLLGGIASIKFPQKP